jgi:hypothetical protein
MLLHISRFEDDPGVRMWGDVGIGGRFFIEVSWSAVWPPTVLYHATVREEATLFVLFLPVDSFEPTGSAYMLRASRDGIEVIWPGMGGVDFDLG